MSALIQMDQDVKSVESSLALYVELMFLYIMLQTNLMGLIDFA